MATDSGAPPASVRRSACSLNIMEFCKQYNERTATQAGQIIPVVITVFEDRTFTFITKTPPASLLIKTGAEHRVGQRASRTARRSAS